MWKLQCSPFFFRTLPWSFIDPRGPCPPLWPGLGASAQPEPAARVLSPVFSNGHLNAKLRRHPDMFMAEPAHALASDDFPLCRRLGTGRPSGVPFSNDRGGLAL